MTTLMDRHDIFTNNLDNEHCEVTQVYKPFNSKIIENLNLTREVTKEVEESKEIQLKMMARARDAVVKEMGQHETENGGFKERMPGPISYSDWI